MPLLHMTDEAREILINYSWPGNIRQLKNITEQMNVLEHERLISAETLTYYLPHEDFGNRTMTVTGNATSNSNFSEREILYKVLFDMKNDLNDLKKLVGGMLQSGVDFANEATNADLVQRIFSGDNYSTLSSPAAPANGVIRLPQNTAAAASAPPVIEVEETLSLQNSERDLIERALKKHRNKRKYAADELGISERTLYRKIKEYNLTK